MDVVFCRFAKIPYRKCDVGRAAVDCFVMVLNRLGVYVAVAGGLLANLLPFLAPQIAAGWEPTEAPEPGAVPAPPPPTSRGVGWGANEDENAGDTTPASFSFGLWGQCSVTCGHGVKFRQVIIGPACEDKPAEGSCLPPSTQKSCDLVPCVEDGAENTTAAPEGEQLRSEETSALESCALSLPWVLGVVLLHLPLEW